MPIKIKSALLMPIIITNITMNITMYIVQDVHTFP